MLEKFHDCCRTALAALDGVYGLINEMIMLIFFVLIFNVLIKWLLKKLHQHFEKQNKIWQDSFVRALYLPLFCYIWFFAIFQAINLILAASFDDPFSITRRHTILLAGAVIAFCWFLLRWKKKIVYQLALESRKKELQFDQTKMNAIDKVATVTIIFFTLLVLLDITGQSLNTIIAFGGIGGLALAFASQEIISNFFSGFMIYMTQPFAIGDWIHLPEKEIEGTVEEIGWYMTLIRTLDKRPVYIPNSIFSKIVIVNPSRMSHRQFKEVLALSCENMPKMKLFIQDVKKMLEEHPDIDKNQTLLVRFLGFGQYSLDVLIQYYTRTTDTDGFSRIREDIYFKISDLLQKHGCSTAIPSHHILYQDSKTTLQTE